ncbi:MAG: oligosaccharide flippase family protein, partial [Proteobacteria bacterium]|nr:oligosaccharide flippase family protein [Pseudomonadota bacterium]
MRTILAFIYKLSKGNFVQNVAIIATGTAGAQAITMIFAPIITRLYGPEAFGLQGTFVALVAVLTPIAALSYPIAIVLPKEDNDAKGIAQLSTYISLTISVLVMLAIIVGGDRILALLGIEALTALVLLIPLNMLFSSWLQIAQQWLIRKKQFRITAKLAVVQALIVNCAKAGIGWFNPLGSVLIILFTFGSAFHAAMLYMAARQTGMSGGQTPQAQTRTPLLELARRHSDFPVYRAPQVFINAISQSLPVLMLAAFFGPASAGFYALGKGVLGMPTQLIGQSVADVFYPRIAEAAHKDENLTRLIIKATLALAAVGFFPSAIIVAFGPGLFGFVFGAKWIVAGEYAQWIALMSFFNFINRPAVAAVPV